ncbi:hypothetical protein BGZ76_008514 [Entomortierella beljakovae]|nr:hypothetical protein BGZ76_008514 [Entomortierella beljakovae]
MNNHDTVISALISNLASSKRSTFWGHESTTCKPLFSIQRPTQSDVGHIQVLSTVDGSDISIQYRDSTQALDLVCCCWATYTKMYAPHKNSVDDINENGSKDGLGKSIPMMDAFDIVVLQNELDGVTEISKAISTQTIKRLAGSSSDLVGEELTSSEFSAYIWHASKIRVRMSNDCKQLLKSYFQVMRKKGTTLDTNEISSISMMSTLLKLAESHAKICLRSVATTEDALVRFAAVYFLNKLPMLFKNTAQAEINSKFEITGISRLGFTPLSNGKENSACLYGESSAYYHDTSQSRASVVPYFEHSEYELGFKSYLAETDKASVPINVEEGRDLVMERMYEHLLRVITENAED